MKIHELTLLKKELFELHQETGLTSLENAISFAKFGNTDKFNLKKITEIFINELSGCSLLPFNIRTEYSDIARGLQ